MRRLTFVLCAAALALAFTGRPARAADVTGKWTATIIAFTILMLLMNVLPEAKPILLAACTAGLLVSFVLYVARFLGVLREAGT